MEKELNIAAEAEINRSARIERVENGFVIRGEDRKSWIAENLDDALLKVAEIVG